MHNQSMRRSILRIARHQLAIVIAQREVERRTRIGIDNLEVRYRFYPELGLAVRMADGRIAELALAQIPRRSFFE